MDRGAWWATYSPRSQTQLKQLSIHACIMFTFFFSINITLLGYATLSHCIPLCHPVFSLETGQCCFPKANGCITSSTIWWPRQKTASFPQGSQVPQWAEWVGSGACFLNLLHTGSLWQQLYTMLLLAGFYNNVFKTKRPNCKNAPLEKSVSWAIWIFFCNNSALGVTCSFNTFTTPDFKMMGCSYILGNHKGLLQLTSILFWAYLIL